MKYPERHKTSCAREATHVRRGRTLIDSEGGEQTFESISAAKRASRGLGLGRVRTEPESRSAKKSRKRGSRGRRGRGEPQ